MFEDLDEATKKQVLPLRTVNRKAAEFQGFIMNWEGTRRLDDFEGRYWDCLLRYHCLLV